MLKSPEEFFDPDPRFANIVQSFDPSTGALVLKSPQSLHEDVAPLELSETAPPKVRHQFELARNVYVYSWFVYDFATVAEQQAYAALEAALRHHYVAETGKEPDKPSLKDLLEMAVARHWLDRREFARPLAIAPDGEVFTELDLLRVLRNNLAHGKFHLMPNGSLMSLQTCHAIISRLFPGDSQMPDRVEQGSR